MYSQQVYVQLFVVYAYVPYLGVGLLWQSDVQPIVRYPTSFVGLSHIVQKGCVIESVPCHLHQEHPPSVEPPVMLNWKGTQVRSVNCLGLLYCHH